MNDVTTVVADDAATDTTAAANASDTVAAGGGSDTVQAGAGDDSQQGSAADDTQGKDWRAEWAGEDAEVLKFLGRHASPAAAIKEFKKLHGDLRSGKFIKPIDENSTDEEKAAWAKLMGVPEKPEGYLEKLPDGLVIGDDDKPAIDAFAAAMHKAGVGTAGVHAALQAYYDIVDEQMGAQVEANDRAKQLAEDELRAEWGSDYRRNLNVLKTFTDSLPDGIGEMLLGAVGSDGVQLLNNPGLAKWLIGIALEQNPLSTVVPGAGANQASAIAEEKAKIEKVMRENRTAYNKDTAMQARYRELIDADMKLKARGG